jgi:hypothetical protein
VRRKIAVSHNRNNFSRLEEKMSFCKKQKEVSVVSWFLPIIVYRFCAILRRFSANLRRFVFGDFLQALKMGKVFKGSFSRDFETVFCPKQQKKCNRRMTQVYPVTWGSFPGRKLLNPNGLNQHLPTHKAQSRMIPALVDGT